MMDGIRFCNVTKVYPKSIRPAVDDCTLDVEAGSLVVLLGPSGCGKTTLLKMVNRLIEPSAGDIYLDGVNIRELEVTQLRRRIGYVIQQVGLFPHMTVGENIAVVPELLNWDRKRIAARIEELLELTNLPPGEFCQRYPVQLSGGQQQRVGLARALAANPQVMLMDEPFGAIDAITRANLQQEMISLHRKIRKTILFVTHDVEEALCLADKIAVMQEGRIVQYDTPFQILNHPQSKFVYNLVGAGDVVRQLSQLRVKSVMAPFSERENLDHLPQIPLEANLRQALSELLRSGAGQLVVMDRGEPAGLVSLDQIQLVSRNKVEPPHELRPEKS